jgi:hypothetical protein
VRRQPALTVPDRLAVLIITLICLHLCFFSLLKVLWKALATFRAISLAFSAIDI